MFFGVLNILFGWILIFLLILGLIYTVDVIDNYILNIENMREDYE